LAEAAVNRQDDRSLLVIRKVGMTEFAKVDRVLKKATERGDVPGVVAMSATRDGPAYQGAFGRRALPDGAAMTADTVFWIASMTKAITSTAAMQLVEQGRLPTHTQIALKFSCYANPHGQP
jgi:methyl acetate hydrolase